VLVALAVTVVEKLPGLAGDQRSPPVAATSDDEFVVMFGAVPETGATLSVDELQPEGEHIVRPGDTLSSIAEERLGSATRAGEIAELNGIADPDQLFEGQLLKLP
jgi:nucleoid-associated protein YgaU